jgi:hypothetical protein
LANQTDVDEMLENMQRRGVIEEPQRLWSSLVLLVREKNGT